MINLSACNVGWQQIRSKLYPAEIALQILGQRFDRPSLGQAGKTLNQQVSVGKQPDNQGLYDTLTNKNTPLILEVRSAISPGAGALLLAIFLLCLCLCFAQPL